MIYVKESNIFVRQIGYRCTCYKCHMVLGKIKSVRTNVDIETAKHTDIPKLYPK